MRIPTLHGQTADDFPLQVTITASEDYPMNVSAAQRVQAASMGAATPDFMMFRGTINGESHWVFGCRKEVMGHESVPCTMIPIGEYRGRWTHDYSLIEIVGGAPLITRFLTVDKNVKDPPNADDPLLHLSVFNFAVKVPDGRTTNDYPILLHVYGSVSLQLPVRQAPARSNCNAYTWSAYQTTVNCTASPAREIDHGFVTADVSIGSISHAFLNCEAKWRWSHCAAVEPGLYYARADKKHLILLTHDSKGNPREIGFEANLPNDPALQSPIK
jgi:hypothetical protein